MENISNCPYQIFIIDEKNLEIKDFNNNKDIYPIEMGILEIVIDFVKNPASSSTLKALLTLLLFQPNSRDSRL